MKPLRLSLLLLAVVVLSLSAAPLQPAAAQAPRLPKLILAGPPGPLSIPLVYLVTHDRLADVAEDVELILWSDQNQLRAIVAGGQADFVTMPSNNAAIFYNNELPLQLLDISVWNASYGVSADQAITSLADAVGQRIVIPFQGSVPDLLFQSLATANDLDPLADFEVTYSTNPAQAAQLLISGQADLAILPEPQVTAVLLQTQASDRPLYRAFGIGEAWDEATGGAAEAAPRTAIAGTVVLTDVQSDPAVIAAFQREYALAVAWTIEHPEKAGSMAEEALPELGFSARPVALSLQNVTWEYTPAAEAQAEIDAFFAILLDLSPDVLGGQLPDAGFYYGQPTE